jgi:hypothetical protein
MAHGAVSPSLEARRRRARRRTTILIAGVLAAAAIAAYAMLFTDWGRSLRTAQEACASLPTAVRDAIARAEDCVIAERTLRQALATAPDGAITTWTSIKSGARGTIRLSPAPARDGAACRRAALSVVHADATARTEVVACVKDGRWSLVEESR